MLKVSRVPTSGAQAGHDVAAVDDLAVHAVRGRPGRLLVGHVDEAIATALQDTSHRQQR